MHRIVQCVTMRIKRLQLGTLACCLGIPWYVQLAYHSADVYLQHSQGSFWQWLGCLSAAAAPLFLLTAVSCHVMDIVARGTVRAGVHQHALVAAAVLNELAAAALPQLALVAPLQSALQPYLAAMSLVLLQKSSWCIMLQALLVLGCHTLRCVQQVLFSSHYTAANMGQIADGRTCSGVCALQNTSMALMQIESSAVNLTLGAEGHGVSDAQHVDLAIHWMLVAAALLSAAPIAQALHAFLVKLPLMAQAPHPRRSASGLRLDTASAAPPKKTNDGSVPVSLSEKALMAMLKLDADLASDKKLPEAAVPPPVNPQPQPLPQHDQHVVSLQTPAAVHRRMVTTVRLLEIVITAALFFSQHWAGILKLSGPTPSSDAAAHAALASTMLAFGCVAMLLVNVLGALNAGQAYLDTAKLVNRTTTILVWVSKVCIMLLAQTSADVHLLSWTTLLSSWLTLLGIAVVEERLSILIGQALPVCLLISWMQPINALKGLNLVLCAGLLPACTAYVQRWACAGCNADQGTHPAALVLPASTLPVLLASITSSRAGRSEEGLRRSQIGGAHSADELDQELQFMGSILAQPFLGSAPKVPTSAGKPDIMQEHQQHGTEGSATPQVPAASPASVCKALAGAPSPAQGPSFSASIGSSEYVSPVGSQRGSEAATLLHELFSLADSARMSSAAWSAAGATSSGSKDGSTSAGCVAWSVGPSGFLFDPAEVGNLISALSQSAMDPEIARVLLQKGVLSNMPAPESCLASGHPTPSTCSAAPPGSSSQGASASSSQHPDPSMFRRYISAVGLPTSHTSLGAAEQDNSPKSDPLPSELYSALAGLPQAHVPLESGNNVQGMFLDSDASRAYARSPPGCPASGETEAEVQRALDSVGLDTEEAFMLPHQRFLRAHQKHPSKELSKEDAWHLEQLKMLQQNFSNTTDRTQRHRQDSMLRRQASAAAAGHHAMSEPLHFVNPDQLLQRNDQIRTSIEDAPSQGSSERTQEPDESRELPRRSRSMPSRMPTYAPYTQSAPLPKLQFVALNIPPALQHLQGGSGAMPVPTGINRTVSAGPAKFVDMLAVIKEEGEAPQSNDSDVSAVGPSAATTSITAPGTGASFGGISKSSGSATTATANSNGATAPTQQPWQRSAPVAKRPTASSYAGGCAAHIRYASNASDYTGAGDSDADMPEGGQAASHPKKPVVVLPEPVAAWRRRAHAPPPPLIVVAPSEDEPCDELAGSTEDEEDGAGIGLGEGQETSSWEHPKTEPLPEPTQLVQLRSIPPLDDRPVPHRAPADPASNKQAAGLRTPTNAADPAAAHTRAEQARVTPTITGAAGTAMQSEPMFMGRRSSMDQQPPRPSRLGASAMMDASSTAPGRGASSLSQSTTVPIASSIHRATSSLSGMDPANHTPPPTPTSPPLASLLNHMARHQLRPPSAAAAARGSAHWLLQQQLASGQGSPTASSRAYSRAATGSVPQSQRSSYEHGMQAMQGMPLPSGTDAGGSSSSSRLKALHVEGSSLLSGLAPQPHPSERPTAPSSQRISPEDALSLGAQAYDQLLQSMSSPFAPFNNARARPLSTSVIGASVLSTGQTDINSFATVASQGQPVGASFSQPSGAWPDIARVLPSSVGGSSDVRSFAQDVHPSLNKQGSLDPRIEDFHKTLMAGTSSTSSAWTSNTHQQASTYTRTSSHLEASVLAVRAQELRVRREALWVEAQRIAAQEADIAAAMAVAAANASNGSGDGRARTRQHLNTGRSNTSSTLSPSNSAVMGLPASAQNPTASTSHHLLGSSARHNANSTHGQHGLSQKQAMMQHMVLPISQDSASGSKSQESMHWSHQLNKVMQHSANMQNLAAVAFANNTPSSAAACAAAMSTADSAGTNVSSLMATPTSHHVTSSGSAGASKLAQDSHAIPSLAPLNVAVGSLGSGMGSLGMGLQRSRGPSHTPLPPSKSSNSFMAAASSGTLGLRDADLFMSTMSSPGAAAGAAPSPLSAPAAAITAQRLPSTSPTGLPTQSMRSHSSLSPQPSMGLPVVPEGASLSHHVVAAPAAALGSKPPIGRTRTLGRGPHPHLSASHSQHSTPGFSSLSMPVYVPEREMAGSGGTPRGGLNPGLSSGALSTGMLQSTADGSMGVAAFNKVSVGSVNSMADVQLGSNWDSDGRRSGGLTAAAKAPSDITAASSSKQQIGRLNRDPALQGSPLTFSARNPRNSSHLMAPGPGLGLGGGSGSNKKHEPLPMGSGAASNSTARRQPQAVEAGAPPARPLFSIAAQLDILRGGKSPGSGGGVAGSQQPLQPTTVSSGKDGTGVAVGLPGPSSFPFTGSGDSTAPPFPIMPTPFGSYEVTSIVGSIPTPSLPMHPISSMSNKDSGSLHGAVGGHTTLSSTCRAEAGQQGTAPPSPQLPATAAPEKGPAAAAAGDSAGFGKPKKKVKRVFQQLKSKLFK